MVTFLTDIEHIYKLVIERRMEDVMLLKTLMLGVSIEFGMLAIVVTLRFIVFPLYQNWNMKSQPKDIVNNI